MVSTYLWQNPSVRLHAMNPMVLRMAGKIVLNEIISRQQAIQRMQLPPACLERISLEDWFYDYRDDVVTFWNEWMDCGWVDRIQALLVHGTTRSGKSYFIKSCLLRGCEPEHIFIPDWNKDNGFAWQGFDNDVHKVGK